MSIQLSKLVFATEYVLNTLPGSVVGGSLGLHTRKLLSRTPNDIDIFYYRDYFPDDLKSLEIVDPQKISPFCTDVFGETITRRSLNINGVPVCLFVVPPEQCKYDILKNDFYRFEIPVQLPIYAIEAKKQYFERYGDEKHGKDIVEIYQSFFKT